MLTWGILPAGWIRNFYSDDSSELVYLLTGLTLKGPPVAGYSAGLSPLPFKPGWPHGPPHPKLKTDELDKAPFESEKSR